MTIMLTTLVTMTARRRMAGFRRRCETLTRQVLEPLHTLERRLKLQPHKPLVDGDRFTVRLAADAREIQAAQRLRYRVFVAEQGHGAGSEGLDRDEYDASALHLLVIDKSSGDVVGTYRVRPGYLVRRSPGWYSLRQYEIAGLRRIEGELCEVGRSCVAPEFRSGAVVALLWAGLLELMRRIDCRYMIGCASLETLETEAGWALYGLFRREDKLSARVACAPRPGFELAQPAAAGAYSDRELRKLMPPLIKGYLRLGAEIGGLPSYDPEFGSIDFMIFFDIRNIDRRYLKHFCG